MALELPWLVLVTFMHINECVVSATHTDTTQKELSEISGSVKLHIGDSWGKPEIHKCPHINVLSVATHKC